MFKKDNLCRVLLVKNDRQIATSFAASFFVAMRARDLGEVQVRQFLRQVGKELWARPMAFFLTPGGE